MNLTNVKLKSCNTCKYLDIREDGDKKPFTFIHKVFRCKKFGLKQITKETYLWNGMPVYDTDDCSINEVICEEGVYEG